MKITKSQLKQIIKEELKILLEEAPGDPTDYQKQLKKFQAGRKTRRDRREIAAAGDSRRQADASFEKEMNWKKWPRENQEFLKKNIGHFKNNGYDMVRAVPSLELPGADEHGYVTLHRSGDHMLFLQGTTAKYGILVAGVPRGGRVTPMSGSAKIRLPEDQIKKIFGGGAARVPGGLWANLPGIGRMQILGIFVKEGSHPL